MNNQTVKPELKSPEMKSAYFAQYWGQQIQTYKLTYSWRRNVKVDGSASGFITLTPLDQITDEDAIACAKLGFTFFETSGFDVKVTREGSKVFVAALGDNTLLVKIEITNPFKLNIYQIDYLRSIGIALPWNGHSVQELIEAGYMKLREGGEKDE